MKINNLVSANTKIAVFILILSLNFNSLFAQKFSTVKGLAFNGQSVSTAKVNVFPPGKGTNLTGLSIGYQMLSGTKLVIPANTIVLLQSPGGKQVLKSTQGKTIEYSLEINDKGENHTIKGIGARIENTVFKALSYNYKNTNGKGTTAASKGTVFTFTDFSQSEKEKASITTSEGNIYIIDEIPISVDGKPVKKGIKGKEEFAAKSLTTQQSANDGEFVSSDETFNYDNFEDAINDIRKDIDNGDIDPEDWADDLMCLGDLYMDMDRAADAIEPYKKAAGYYNEIYGDDDLYTLEARISLAEAYMHSGNESEGNVILSECIDILQEILGFDNEDFDYAKENDDSETMEIICEDISEICEFLGWAYDIGGNHEASDEYYKKSESNCE